MTEAEIRETLDTLRAEVDSRIQEALAAGDSAAAQRLSGGWTSLAVLGRLLGVDGE